MTAAASDLTSDLNKLEASIQDRVKSLEKTLNQIESYQKVIHFHSMFFLPLSSRVALFQ